MSFFDHKTDEQPPTTYTYSCARETTYNSNHVASVAFIKLVPTLDDSQPIQSQVQLINFGPASGSVSVSPYEALHSHIQLAIAPYFESYVEKKAVGDESSLRIPGKDSMFLNRTCDTLRLTILLSH